MEHIHEFDWCATGEEPYFLNEKELDNCVTERILRNKFFDPLISSDSENEDKPHKINWDEVFTRKQVNSNSNKQHINVPGMRAIPPYPKLSSMSGIQHYQCLKVLCAENPKILEAEFIPRPTKQDHRVFEEIKTAYEKEQQEYLEWARQLWISNHCIRALRPRPSIETVYEAEFKIKAYAVKSFPNSYEMAAQIPLESRCNRCDLMLESDLVTVDTLKLPQIQVPDMVTRQFSVMSLYSTPEPCSKHPSRFVLPNEQSMTILPLTEVNRELSQFAMDNNAVCIASESAVKSLVQRQSPWRLPLSVCQAIAPDGETTNIIVISNTIPRNRQSAQTRAYRALRHLVYNALIPLAEKRRLLESSDLDEEKINNDEDKINNDDEQTIENQEDHDNLIQLSDLNMTVSSDDEDDNLFIDTGEDLEEISRKDDPRVAPDVTVSQPVSVSENTSEIAPDIESPSSKGEEKSQNKSLTNDDEIGIYSCTCKDTPFGRPPPRSFKKYNIKNFTNKENYSMIIHCPHKTRDGDNEVLLEPIVEYQIDLGATKQSDDTLKSLALSLHLRPNAIVMNTRIDGPTGDLVTIEPMSLQDIKKQQSSCIEDAANTLYTLINQLQGLLPGHYVLEHESCHGPNAFLYAAKNTGAEQKLQLVFDCIPIADVDEAKGAQVPPVLTDVLLPYHKLRKILPLAFTPHQHQVAKESRKRVTRQKTPPRAIRWPKKKQKKKYKN